MHEYIHVRAVVFGEAAFLVDVYRARVVGVDDKVDALEADLVKAVFDGAEQGFFAVALVLHGGGDDDAPFGFVALVVEEFDVADKVAGGLFEHGKKEGVIVDPLPDIFALLLI